MTAIDVVPAIPRSWLIFRACCPQSKLQSGVSKRASAQTLFLPQGHREGVVINWRAVFAVCRPTHEGGMNKSFTTRINASARTMGIYGYAACTGAERNTGPTRKPSRQPDLGPELDMIPARPSRVTSRKTTEQDLEAGLGDDELVNQSQHQPCIERFSRKIRWSQGDAQMAWLTETELESPPSTAEIQRPSRSRKPVLNLDGLYDQQQAKHFYHKQ
ncbi:hypothetical protein [Chitinolyticbacter albus]|uniref:hypothetical protein n=1 Tax=Chitinolyticbacter albus TaxID=2961951 RepID=UPI002108EDEC|nr:hypothetical protein [Chitinolyticbacter albus]